MLIKLFYVSSHLNFACLWWWRWWCGLLGCVVVVVLAVAVAVVVVFGGGGGGYLSPAVLVYVIVLVSVRVPIFVCVWSTCRSRACSRCTCMVHAEQGRNLKCIFIFLYLLNCFNVCQCLLNSSMITFLFMLINFVLYLLLFYAY